ncbi:DUF5067 domain-containing protein [Bifidobacterium felsineum]|uniref:DUF5067 domain-containing protein n=1 Tax=Bifidobacterium felsineum TaxID=2045440 RepID=UPI001BDCE609|nr:DUF5067 domain-containing protein [Bifidobacterium felsineum]MBT1165143.1 DUF5067 domain-containing protein [Bifidobacterium felsineum]
MGLANHDDDYVSPFDDGLPSYVDPSKRAEYLSKIVDTRHQMHEQAEQRAKEWASASRKPSKKPSSKPSNTASHKSAQHSGNRTAAPATGSTSGSSKHGAARRPNPVVVRQSSTKPRKKRRAFFWVIIVCTVILGLADPILNTTNNWLGSIVRTPGSSSQADSGTGAPENPEPYHGDDKGNTANSDDSTSQATVEKTSDVLDISGKTQGVLTIASAKAGPNDFTGQPTVIVTFNWSNTSKKAITFDTLTHPEVYQNGLQLREITFSKSTEVPGYSYESSQTEVKPGGEFNTTLAFTLRDTSAPIYVQSDRSTWYRESPLIVSAFTPNGDGSWTQVKSNTVVPAPQATDDDRKGMKTLGTTEYDTFSYALAGAKRGPTDAMDSPSAIVSIDWINDTGNNASLSYFGDVSIMQDGVKLDSAYYLTNPEGFVDDSYTLNSQRGVKATVQYAVELRDEASPITVTFTPYSTGSKAESKTFQLK